jgi:hypothetical protein
MPHGDIVARPDKLTKIVAVFDQFHRALALLDDPEAKRFAAYWVSARDSYVTPKGAPRSAFAAGMEQGLRETPMSLESMRPEVRKRAAEALAEAITEHYPEFLAKDVARLEKIKARGAIRGESEFYLVRHRIDLLEGEVGAEVELQKCYKLIDQFEAKARGA